MVLMSTYNGEKYIKNQIDSILKQRGCLVELIIRDDGSTDKTPEIINEYKDLGLVKTIDENINLRPAKSFLRLLERAPKCNYYAFADQDDVWDDDKLISAIQRLKNEMKPAMYCSNARVVDKNMNYSGINVYKNDKYVNFESVIINGNFMGCTMVINNYLRDKIMNVKEAKYYLMHDYFISAFCALIDGKIIYDSIPHMNYRIHSNNTVGVSTNIFGKIKKKIKHTFMKKEPKILMQCTEMLKITSCGSKENRDFINLVSNYNKGLKSKWKLINNKKIKYENLIKKIETIINVLREAL